jgi:hypothetical protein
MKPSDDPAGWVTAVIQDFVRESPENSLRNPANEKAWGEPLVGFSRREGQR